MSDERVPPRRHLREYVAEEIRVLLARKRMSGVELGRRIGMKQSAVSRRISGEVAFNTDELEAIAVALEVDVIDLLPKDARASSERSFHYEPAARTADPLAPRPVSGGPFGGGRRDSTRPVSAVPASRRRPQMVRSPRGPKAA